jgi:hypothetical protein
LIAGHRRLAAYQHTGRDEIPPFPRYRHLAGTLPIWVGDDNISTAERVLVRRAAMLSVQMEMLECRFAEQDGEATSLQLNDYQRCLNTCRRTLEALGLKRVARDVGPTLGQNCARALDATARPKTPR